MIAGSGLGGYSSCVRRFIILIVVLQLVAGGLVGQVHAEQLADGTSDVQFNCQSAPGPDGDQDRGACDSCSHGLVNGVAVELGSNILVLAPSKPVSAEESAAKSWLDHPAGEPPK